MNQLVSCNFSKVHIVEDEQLKKFWEIEEIQSPIPYSNDDTECETHFKNTTFRNSQGQFVVKFPFKYPTSLLGSSRDTAVKRMLSLERKFNDVTFKKLYHEFIHEYQELGHMTKVPIDKFEDNKSISYFLPHHGVLRENHITTKLRTVFDGSCQSTTGWSLND